MSRVSKHENKEKNGWWMVGERFHFVCKNHLEFKYNDQILFSYFIKLNFNYS
jgi:hypothetical protein